jgi:hypothetical protein
MAELPPMSSVCNVIVADSSEGGRHFLVEGDFLEVVNALAGSRQDGTFAIVKQVAVDHVGKRSSGGFIAINGDHVQAVTPVDA